MSWDLILTPYDEREYRLLRAISGSPGAVRTLRDRLHLRVRRDERDPDVVARLNEADDLRTWLQVVFAETVTRGTSAFLGHDASLEDYGKAASRRWGEKGEALAARLALLGEGDPLLTRVPLDTAGQVLLASPRTVAEVAELIRALEPSLRPLAPDAVDALVFEGPPDRSAIRGPAFFDWALPALLGYLLWAADEELGLAISFDELPRLKADEPLPAPARELELVAPERLVVLDRREAELRGRGSRAGGCLVVVLVMLLVFLLALFALYVAVRLKLRGGGELSDVGCGTDSGLVTRPLATPALRV